MIKILFVCHGNICRSPMAEFVFRDMVKKQGMESLFSVASAATSAEEIGNPVHSGTVSKLKQYEISTEGKHAAQLQKRDYSEYDYLVGMEQRNINNIYRIIGQDTENKVYRLLEFCANPRDIADPWYTGDFDRTYWDVLEGCEGMLTFLKEKHNLDK